MENSKDYADWKSKVAITATILFLNVFLSETTWAIFTRFHMELSIEWFCAIEKMGAMSVYGEKT